MLRYYTGRNAFSDLWQWYSRVIGWKNIYLIYIDWLIDYCWCNYACCGIQSCQSSKYKKSAALFKLPRWEKIKKIIEFTYGCIDMNEKWNRIMNLVDKKMLPQGAAVWHGYEKDASQNSIHQGYFCKNRKQNVYNQIVSF